MKDNEIIKALECCYTYFDCDGCPFEEPCSGLNVLTENTLDLIKRQKAEIERLQKENKQILDNCAWCEEWQTNELLGERAKAIKEFAERVKQEINFPLAVWKVFDNLVKEMTEQ